MKRDAMIFQRDEMKRFARIIDDFRRHFKRLFGQYSFHMPNDSIRSKMVEMMAIYNTMEQELKSIRLEHGWMYERFEDAKNDTD